MLVPFKITSKHKTKLSLLISSFYRRAMQINKWIIKVIILSSDYHVPGFVGINITFHNTLHLSFFSKSLQILPFDSAESSKQSSKDVSSTNMCTSHSRLRTRSFI